MDNQENLDRMNKEQMDCYVDVDNASKKRAKKSDILFKIVGIIFAVLCIVFLIVAVGYKSKYDKALADNKDLSVQIEELTKKNKKLEAKNTSLVAENTSLENENGSLKTENNELVNGAKKQLTDIRNAYEDKDWDKVIKLSKKLHKQYNGSEEDKEAQKLAEKSQEEIDVKKQKEEAEKAKGYETGITYKQLARTPDKYEGKKVKFSGEVIQVIEGDSSTQIRLAINSDYDTVIIGEFENSTTSTRILEDDIITIYGTSVGTVTYQSTLGGQITIPGIYIEKIEQ